MTSPASPSKPTADEDETPENVLAMLLTSGAVFTATADASFHLEGSTVRAGPTLFIYCDLSGIFSPYHLKYSIHHGDLMPLWSAIKEPKNLGFGLYIWAAIKSKEKPMSHVVEQLKEKGVWNKTLEDLPPNNFELNKLMTNTYLH